MHTSLACVHVIMFLQAKVAGGSILVRPLTQDWVHACGGLLTTAFADAMGYVPMYRSGMQSSPNFKRLQGLSVA